jgi:integrase
LTKRRSRGDGGLRWSEQRQRWIAEVTIGYTPAGKRVVKTASAKTKTAAKAKLDEIRRDHQEGEATTNGRYTVADAVTDWLKYGLNGRDEDTIEKLRILAETHVIPGLGARELRNPARPSNVLSAEDIDKWLEQKATRLSTRTLRELLSILRRSIRRAQAREKVKRNVALLCDCPVGGPGRPSKSLTLAQAEAVLNAAEADDSTMGAYVVVSLLSGARTEEVRPLTWSHVHLPPEETGEEHKEGANGKPQAHIDVWRSVRVGGDTKTRRSRRSLAIPIRCVGALRAQHQRQARHRSSAAKSGKAWHDNDLVFASEVGTELHAANVRRGFRRIVKAAGLTANDWTPRELRHSFVSLLSDANVPIEVISRLVGHSGTSVTEQIYRHQIRPIVEDGATEMDRIFPTLRSPNA